MRFVGILRWRKAKGKGERAKGKGKGKSKKVKVRRQKAEGRSQWVEGRGATLQPVPDVGVLAWIYAEA